MKIAVTTAAEAAAEKDPPFTISKTPPRYNDDNANNSKCSLKCEKCMINNVLQLT